MSSLFFAKIFCVFVFVVCASCEAAHAETANKAGENVNEIKLFNSGSRADIIPENGSAELKKINIKSFFSPLLIAADNVIIAIAGANRNEDPTKNIDILTNYTVTTEDDDWINKAFPTEGTAQNWNTQFALQEGNQKKVLENLAATAKGDKIYILLAKQSSMLPEETVPKWGFLFVDGTVTEEEKKAGVKTKKIAWGKSQLSELSIYKKFQGDLSDSNLQFLSAFVTTDETVVFFVKGKPQGTGKNVFAIIKPKNSNTVSEVLSIPDYIDDACNPNFFLWWDKIIMIPTSCNKDQKIHEFYLADKELKKSEEFNNRVWDFLKDKKDITTAEINGTPAVLFTEEKEKSKSKKEIILWVTDGSRLYKVRSAVPNDGEKNTVAGLLYTKERLFCLQQEVGKETKSIIVTHLQQQEEIKNALKTWKDSDDKVQDFCRATTTSQKTCTTDGLVGFLYGKTEHEKQWKDNYLSVDATVDGSEVKINDDNITFNGAGAGAVWPVKNVNKEQPYSFTNSGFTLVATLTINKNEERIDNSLLGLVIKGENKRIGLLCAADGKWKVKIGNGEGKVQSSDVVCESDTLYFVGLMLNDSKLLIYVDGEKLTKLNSGEMTIEPSKNIDHFYFGSKTQLKTKTDVTITNVLLYNRPLPPEEITKFKPKQIQREIVKRETGGDSTAQQEPKGGTIETDKQPSTSATKNDLQSSSPPPTTEDSAVRVGVVGLLCFMLFCVFTLLGHYVY